MCENTVAEIMKQQQIRARSSKTFVPCTTDSRHQEPVAQNLLGRQFNADLPDRKWAADITYIPTDQGWLYLAGVIDLCSRRIVGWSMADHMETDLVSEALKMAIARRRPGQGLLHHSRRRVDRRADRQVDDAVRVRPGLLAVRRQAVPGELGQPGARRPAGTGAQWPSTLWFSGTAMITGWSRSTGPTLLAPPGLPMEVVSVKKSTLAR